MNNHRPIVRTAVNIGLMLVGSLFFALGFPSFIADWGWAPFAWISLIPVVILIRRIPWWSSPLWGAAYGYITYALFNFWLATFNPVSFVLVPTIYAGWFFMLFPILTLLDRTFTRFGWLAQAVSWVTFDVIRTKGFIAYSYGVIGYSQYGWRSLISIADIFGVMGVSFLVVIPSFLIGGWLAETGFLSTDGGLTPKKGWKMPSRRWKISAGVWAVLMLAANVYGIVTKVDYSESPTWRPALIQHNVNTWLSGIDAWRTALDALIEESEEALKEKPDAVIWSETAFVPAIEWHLQYRRDRERVALIQRLQEFLEDEDVPFIIGNNDAVQDAGKRVEYNAVLRFDGKDIVGKYRKIHLVPFSEHFPYAKTFPRLMEYIQSQGTPFYGKGTEYTVWDLEGDGPKVSPLICFEDTFGYLSRNFVREGAEVLVNVTNDSWSPEPASAIQHQNMAIFRSVENRRSMVRATTAGLTSVIDPNGKILAKLEPFTQDHLIAEVPVYTGRTTIYNRWGDWFEKFLLILAIPMTAAAAVLQVLRLISERRKERT
ncbi:MAG: apolipoprotein N-acyltransferase [Spirochaetaceae bacterium]|nr:apolipoprotein N-acyltransferase [Spirochaetaceae bacterium]MDT8297804.1 apolipoprotein N-acyltransferase [Spirochaetaceae bacterium]